MIQQPAKRNGGRNGGRHTKLTPELQDAFLNCIRLSLPLNKAAAMVGVTDECILEWVRRGEGRSQQSRVEPYIGFSVAFQKAKADAQARRLARIEKAGQGGELIARKTVTKEVISKTGEKTITTTVEESLSQPQWTADAWVLERSDPEHWARRDRGEMTVRGDPAAPLTVNIVEVEVVLTRDSRDAHEVTVIDDAGPDFVRGGQGPASLPPGPDAGLEIDS